MQGWESVFWGGLGDSWKCLKFKKWFSINTNNPCEFQRRICQKYQDSTTFLVQAQMVHTSWKYFWFHWDLLMILHFVKIMGLPELFHENSFQKRLELKSFLERITKILFKKMWGDHNSKKLKILEFQKVEISQIQIFQGCSSIFLVFFEVKSPWKGGVRVHYGSKKSKILKVPRIIQKVLGYDRGP